MSFLLSPESPPDWSIDPHDLESVLLNRFGEDVEIRGNVLDDLHSLEWVVSTGHDVAICYLDKDRTAVGMDSSLDLASEVAVVVRKVVPDDAVVLFYDEAYLADVRVSAESTASSVLASYLRRSAET